MVKVKYVLFWVLALLSGEAFCADPPAPGPPPPVGLPLPIDDYIPFLMLAGVLLGAFYIHKIRKA